MSILPLIRECILPIGKNSVGEILVGADAKSRLQQLFAVDILTNSSKRDTMLTIEKQNAVVKGNSAFHEPRQGYTSPNSTGRENARSRGVAT